VGTIQGGAALNIVPQSCRFDFEIRYLPGMRPEAVTEALAAYARRQLLPEMRRVGSGSDIQFQLLATIRRCSAIRSPTSPAGWRSGAAAIASPPWRSAPKGAVR
jgi:acetylornithine deacetylase/succinyl-diaminopimelate desuccinylase-like protein